MQDEQQNAGSQEYKYWGFISYSHADEKWADWLHKSLETYVVPKQLVGKPTKYGPIPKKPFPIFRDRDELPSSADLGDKLTAALTGSRYLLVICSPRSVASEWVNEEIKTFKSLGRESQVLCLIVDGEPYASNNPQLGLEECFPEPIRYQVDENRQITDIRTEPIAADARKGKDGKANARLKILSGMFNVNLSDLKQRDHERAQRRLRVILTSVLILFVVFLGLSVNLYFQTKAAKAATTLAESEADRAETALKSAIEQRAIAEKNEKEAKIQRDLAVKNEKRAVENEKRAVAAEKDVTIQRDKAIENEKRAVENEKRARAAEADAKIQRDKAVESERLAVEQKAIAERNEKEAQDQKRRAVSALSISDFNEGTRLADDGMESTAMAYLARSLSWDPENSSAEARLISLMSLKNWSLPRTAPLKHTGPVTDVDYSSDGKYVLTASGTTAQLWDAKTGKPFGDAVAHKNAITSVRFSPDGKKFLTTSDPDAQLWDTESQQKAGPALAHAGGIYAARFNGDGTKVVTCSGDRTGKVWEVESGKQVASVEVGGLPAGVDFSPAGKYFVLSFDSYAQVYDATSGSPLGAQMQHEGGVFGIAFDPNGKYVATASGDSSARVWDALTGAPVTEPLKHEGRVLNVAFSPTGLHIVTTSEDGTARVWDAATGAPVGQPMQHDLDVTRAEFSPNGRWVATASEDRTARVWNAFTGEPVIESIKFEGPVRAIRFSRDGSRLFAGSEDATAQVWTTLSGQPKSEPLSHGPFPIYWASFSSDAKKLITCGHDRVARIWNTGTSQELTEPLTLAGRPKLASFSPDDAQVFVATDNGIVQRFDAQTGDPIGERYKVRGNKVVHVEYSADGSSLLVIGSRGATVLDAKTGEPRFEKEASHSPQVINSGHFNAAGDLFITAGADKVAKVWDSKTGQPKGGPFTHNDGVMDAVFSKDGKYVATCSRDRTARYWELATGKAMVEPMPHDRSINSVDVSPNGVYIITGCDDGTVRVWRTSTGQAAAEPLQHKDRVQSARFSADGRLVVSYGRENVAKVWETANWKLVTAPLVHQREVHSAVFSNDGAFVATASQDETARIWQISLPGDAPNWLTELAETVGGYRMVAAESGGGTELVLNPWEKLGAVRKDMTAGSDDTYAKWGDWFLSDRNTRTVSSFASLNVSDYVDRKVDQADRNSLVEALEIQPDHGLALARLGILETNYTLAGFYTDLAVRYRPNDYRTLWLRGEVLQRQEKFAMAWPILERAAELDPRAVDTFGPEGAEFESINLSGAVAQGWLPKGWVDNNSDKRYNMTYTKLTDGPPGTDAAIRIKAQGSAGRAELLGPCFIARAGSNRVIQFWARGSRGESISVYARGFSGAKGDRPATHAYEVIRIDDEWKQYQVNVRAQNDLAAEVVLQIATSSSGREIDIADCVVRVR